MFTDDHPYIKDAGKEVKEAVEKFVRNSLKMDVPPPEAKKYREAVKGKVYTSHYHGENEVKENERLAKFITSHIDTTIWLLPRLNSNNQNDIKLRKELLPHGVFDRKNPDFYIGGLFFDGKSMLNVEKTDDIVTQKQQIENRIKKAKEQADNIVLEIPEWIELETIAKSLNNYLNRSSKERIILVCWNKRLLKFTGGKK